MTVQMLDQLVTREEVGPPDDRKACLRRKLRWWTPRPGDNGADGCPAGLAGSELKLEWARTRWCSPGATRRNRTPSARRSARALRALRVGRNTNRCWRGHRDLIA